MTEPIRILQVMASLDRGGAEAVVMNWLRQIDRSKVTFDFVVNEGGPYAFESEAIELGSRVLRAPRFRGWNSVSYAVWWRRFLAEHQEWKIVHAHHTAPAAIYLAVARNLGRFTIAHSHNAGRESGPLGVVRQALHLPLRVVADSHLACSAVAGRSMFGERTTVQVVPNAIKVERFAFTPSERDRIRLELGWQDALVIGHVGRFDPQKNHARLLRIFAGLAHNEPRARLLLVGDGLLRPQIEQDIASLGLEGKVVLTGVRTDIPELLSSMDVLLFPSHFEGLPVTVVEAQAAGLPCVVSDAITDEVALTELVTFISLNHPDVAWVRGVQEAASCQGRASRTREIRSAGYDSAEVAAYMQRLYMELNIVRPDPLVPGARVDRPGISDGTGDPT